MLKNTLALVTIFVFSHLAQAQSIEDDFEGNGNINSWFGDDCNINTNLSNPVAQGINTSNTVLEYHDVGGPYANIRFDAGRNFDLANYPTFSLKVYVPSSGLSGNQNNQVSLKLQDGNLGSPWTTQTEIIKNIVLGRNYQSEVEILSGVDEGALVVDEGRSTVLEGQEVEVISSK